MTGEKRNEIIKAHIYGNNVANIAKLEDVSIEEVEEILSDTTAIENMIDYLRREGYIV